MCKYCENIVKQTEFLPSFAFYERAEGECGAKFEIGHSIGNGVRADYWFFGEVYDGRYNIEIYYCPFCGRKLEERFNDQN